MTTKFEDNFDAVIFDMDGTILDSMPWWRKNNLDFLTARGLEPPEEVKADLMNLRNRVAGQLYIDTYHLDMTIEEIMEEYCQQMEVYYRTAVMPKPNLVRYLRHLKAMGKRICVGTGTPSRLALPALGRHNLLEEFEFVLCADDLHMLKDYPEFYLEAARRLNLPPSRCAMFEDALHAMEGAKKAGMWVMGIADPIQKPFEQQIRALCDVYVEDFGQLCV